VAKHGELSIKLIFVRHRPFLKSLPFFQLVQLFFIWLQTGQFDNSPFEGDVSFSWHHTRAFYA
jgi:hypothetical protein